MPEGEFFPALEIMAQLVTMNSCGLLHNNDGIKYKVIVNYLDGTSVSTSINANTKSIGFFEREARVSIEGVVKNLHVPMNKGVRINKGGAELIDGNQEAASFFADNVAEAPKSSTPTCSSLAEVQQVFNDTANVRVATMKRISDAVGLPITVNVDVAKMYAELQALKCSQAGDLPRYINQALDGIANNFEIACKDGMVREAVQDGIQKTKQITFHVQATITFEERQKLGRVMSVGMKFSDGQLIVVVPADQFAPTVVGIRLGAINLEHLL